MQPERLGARALPHVASSAGPAACAAMLGRPLPPLIAHIAGREPSVKRVPPPHLTRTRRRHSSASRHCHYRRRAELLVSLTHSAAPPPLALSLDSPRVLAPTCYSALSSISTGHRSLSCLEFGDVDITQRLSLAEY
jgi:hypothetical protein